MEGFHFNSWLVYFYFYCIAGWIFESGNVSVRQKKWVNRGFMKGPWLPLYGSGALVILIVSLPFEGHPVAVYFASAIAATVLEYITGVVMLALFKVRYWDYRYRKIQFQGHICLVSTIVWGFLGLLMVYIIHPPVVKLVNSWNPEVVSIVTFLVTLCMVYDFTNAFRDAMDLRALIMQAEELKQRIGEAIEERKESIAESIEERKEQVSEALEERKEQMDLKLEKSKEQFVQNMDQKILEYEQIIADVREQRLDSMADMEQALERTREKLEKKAATLLRRNPYASFHNLEKETEEIRNRLKIKWKK